MWTRFPPRMKRILTAALEVAGRRGCDAAAAEHLVLAVCGDRECAGVFVLEQCSVPIAALAEQVEAIAPRGKSRIGERATKLGASILHLIDVAVGQADRLKHAHVGTEHVIVALTHLPQSPAGKLLAESGVTSKLADAAVRRWIAAGMPRNRGVMSWTAFRSPALRTLAWPIQKAARAGEVGWAIFGRKSLAHPTFTRNPYKMYRWLREHDPVRKDPLAPGWVAAKYDYVMTILRDPRFKKDPFAAERLPRLVREQRGADNDGGRADIETVSMLFLDPPEHTRVRGVFTRAFTPRTLSELRPRLEQITAKRLDRVAASGRMDVIADLAYPLPVIVIAELLGFPPEDYEKIKVWSDAFAASLSLYATPAQQAAAGKARQEVRDYFDDVTAKLKNRPADTLLSRLLESERQPGGLNREEIFANCVLLLAAGHETTTNLIGNGILAMMQNREQWNAVVADPSLVEPAVEEMLRFDSPVQWVSRVAGESIELSGVTLPAGQVILGCLGSANRDPTKFTSPDRFDIRRCDEAKHLSFGTGIHFCLGAALAKMETEIALRGLATRFPKMKLARGKLKWLKGLTFRGVTHLPVLLTG
ncbi:hypothetical protein BH10PLA1_BH10PLA1_15620 [soil metagenome]